MGHGKGGGLPGKKKPRLCATWKKIQKGFEPPNPPLAMSLVALTECNALQR